MARLGTPTATIEVLRKYDFHFQKKFGQNFLIEPGILEGIVRAAGVGPEDCVLEIGPGIGTLTQYLAESARQVIAVEIDKNLIPVLADTLSEYSNVTVLNADILKTDIKALADQYNGGRPLKVVANLPYYITTPIILELLENQAPVESLTVMVQAEVADRMQVGPGTKDYGALSLAVQYYSAPKIALHVPASCFMPRPNVDSTVIRLDIYPEPPVSVKNSKHMFALIRAAFNQRRKTLSNGLQNSAELKIPRERTVQALAQMGLSETIRGEALTLEQFAQLSDLLAD